MEHAVALTAGICFLLLGISYFINAGDWVAWIAYLEKQGRRGSLTIGMINALIGGFILGFHWAWEGIGLVLTIVGVLAVIKGLVYMLFPSWLPAKLRMLEPHCYGLLRVSSLLLIAIAAVAFYEWWQYMQDQACLWQPCFNQASIMKE